VAASLNQLIPELVPYARELIRAANAAGLQPRVTSTRRSYADQKRLYDRYLAGASEYPAAPPGQSAHEYGWAFDMIVSPLEELPAVGQYWESLGGVWGGHYHDNIHFEYPGFKATVGPAIEKAGALDVLGTASGFIGLPFALISFLEIASSEEQARKIIEEWNYLTGSNIDPYKKLW
jgi:D-alanyl-D-alanine carboxypeptidase